MTRPPLEIVGNSDPNASTLADDIVDGACGKRAGLERAADDVVFIKQVLTPHRDTQRISLELELRATNSFSP